MQHLFCFLFPVLSLCNGFLFFFSAVTLCFHLTFSADTLCFFLTFSVDTWVLSFSTAVRLCRVLRCEFRLIYTRRTALWPSSKSSCTSSTTSHASWTASAARSARFVRFLVSFFWLLVLDVIIFHCWFSFFLGGGSFLILQFRHTAPSLPVRTCFVLRGDGGVWGSRRITFCLGEGVESIPLVKWCTTPGGFPFLPNGAPLYVSFPCPPNATATSVVPPPTPPPPPLLYVCQQNVVHMMYCIYKSLPRVPTAAVSRNMGTQFAPSLSHAANLVAICLWLSDDMCLVV